MTRVCDESRRLERLLIHLLVFNFWEPLHYLDRGHGFQTWETSPEYAIRSYAYIALHLISVKIPRFLFGDEKVCWDELQTNQSLTVPASENCFLRPPRNPFSGVDSLRGEALSNGSREG